MCRLRDICYIKGDRTKHIAPKLFSTHDLEKEGTVDVKQIKSCDNLANLFTKPLAPKKFEELIHKIGMCRLRDIC
ncbi:unnamed protein product, partial [Cuscuta europaea]